MLIAKKTIGPIHALNVSNSPKMPLLFFSSKILDGVIGLCFGTHQPQLQHMLSSFLMNASFLFFFRQIQLYLQIKNKITFNIHNEKIHAQGKIVSYKTCE
jgi:hypothetical protein